MNEGVREINTILKAASCPKREDMVAIDGTRRGRDDCRLCDELDDLEGALIYANNAMSTAAEACLRFQGLLNGAPM